MNEAYAVGGGYGRVDFYESNMLSLLDRGLRFRCRKSIYIVLRFRQGPAEREITEQTSALKFRSFARGNVPQSRRVSRPSTDQNNCRCLKTPSADRGFSPKQYRPIEFVSLHIARGKSTGVPSRRRHVHSAADRNALLAQKLQSLLCVERRESIALRDHTLITATHVNNEVAC